MDPSLTSYIDQVAQWTGSNSWIIRMFIVILFAATFDMVQRVLLKRLLARLARSDNPWDDALLHSITAPLSLLIWVLGLALAADIAAANSDSAIFKVVEPFRTVGVISSLTWFIVRLIRNAQDNLIKHGLSDDSSVDRSTAEAIGKLLRLSVLITSALVMLQTLGFSISGVLAFVVLVVSPSVLLRRTCWRIFLAV